ncbi:hypothetical protein C2E23DRAFT_741444 [Lenzites betulinus]|nr:hypothetical protein C2E23DRAFT_741444 [Lenzites betulinus]
MAAVNSCRILRDWFERHPENHLHLHWCPAHSGVEENDAVDADVKYMARSAERGHHNIPDYNGRFPRSYAYRKHCITSSILETWEEEVRRDPAKYFGHTHFRHPAFRQLKHTRNFPLKRLGGRPTLVARFVRCLTNHAPTGWYRNRFRSSLNEPTMCRLHSGPPAYHTREHVLFECDHYTRRYRYSSVEDLLSSMDPFYQITEFLKDNPTALSFDDIPGGA